MEQQPKMTIMKNQPRDNRFASSAKEDLLFGSILELSGYDELDHPFRTTYDRNREADADLFLSQQLVQVVNAGNRRTAKAYNDVADPQVCPDSRTIGLDRCDHDAAFHRQAIEAYDPPVNLDILPAYADRASPHLSILDKACYHEFGSIDADGKA